MQVIGRLWSADGASLSRAQDSNTREQFLIRRVRTALIGQGERLQRGIGRIQAIGQRDFPGVLKIERVASTGGEIGIVLPVETGTRTLSEIIDARQQDAQIVASLAGLANQLDELHRQGIVHGDIRCETIVVAPGGQAGLLDFATGHVIHQWTVDARVVPEQISGQFVPKVSFAPEVLRGESASPQSDQYCLALACLEVLTTARRAGPDQTGELLKQLGTTRYKPLAPILERALSDDPAGRYADCGELFRELTASLPVSTSARLRRKSGGILLCLPLIVILGGKWVYTQIAKTQSSWEAKSRRQASLEEAVAAYREPVAKPPEPIADGRLPPDADLTSSSSFDRWRSAFSSQVIDEATRRMNQSFSQLQSQLRSNLSRTVGMSPPTGASYAFAYSDAQGHLASGRADADVQLNFTGFPSPSRELGAVYVRITVGTADGKSQQRDVRLGPGGASSARVDVSPPKSSWTQADKLTVTIAVQHPQSQEWINVPAAIASDVNFGTTSWKTHLPVLVSPAQAARSGNAVSSGVTVAEGTRFRLTVDDKNKVIAPWETTTIKRFSAIGMRRYSFEGEIGIPPEGVTVGISPSTYTLENPQTGQKHWGALIMKIGRQGSWQVPTVLAMPLTAAQSGELLFGLNLPVRYGSKDVLGDPQFWGTKSPALFDVRIETQDVFFPPGAPQSVQATVRRNLR